MSGFNDTVIVCSSSHSGSESCGALKVVPLLFKDHPSDLFALPERDIEGIKSLVALRMGVHPFFWLQ